MLIIGGVEPATVIVVGATTALAFDCAYTNDVECRIFGSPTSVGSSGCAERSLAPRWRSSLGDFLVSDAASVVVAVAEGAIS